MKACPKPSVSTALAVADQKIFWKTFYRANFALRSGVTSAFVIGTAVAVVLPFFNLPETLGTNSDRIASVLSAFNIGDAATFETYKDLMVENQINFYLIHSYNMVIGSLTTFTKAGMWMLLVNMMQYTLYQRGNFFAAIKGDLGNKINALYHTHALNFSTAFASAMHIVGATYLLWDRCSRSYNMLHSLDISPTVLIDSRTLLHIVIAAGATKVIFNIINKQCHNYFEKKMQHEKRELESLTKFSLTNGLHLAAGGRGRAEMINQHHSKYSASTNMLIMGTLDTIFHGVQHIIFDSYISYWLIHLRIANLVFEGAITPQAAIAVKSASRFIVIGFSYFIDSAINIAFLVAVTGYFTSVLREAEQFYNQVGSINVAINPEKIMRTESLRLNIEGKSALELPNIELNKGDYIKVTGQSGIGKTLWLLTIVELYKNGSGRIERCRDIIAISNSSSIPYDERGIFRSIARMTKYKYDELSETQKEQLEAICTGLLINFEVAQADAIGSIDPNINIAVMSTGTVQKIAIISAIVEIYLNANKPSTTAGEHHGNNQLLLLDESTSPIDPDMRDIVHNTIRRLSAGEVFLSYKGVNYALPEKANLAVVQVSHTAEQDCYTRIINLTESRASSMIADYAATASGRAR